MSMLATPESARYGCSIGFDLLVQMLNVVRGKVSVNFAEDYVGEVHLAIAIVDGFVLCVCGHDWSLNGLFNRMITSKLYRITKMKLWPTNHETIVVTASSWSDMSMFVVSSCVINGSVAKYYLGGSNYCTSSCQLSSQCRYVNFDFKPYFQLLTVESVRNLSQ